MNRLKLKSIILVIILCIAFSVEILFYCQHHEAKQQEILKVENSDKIKLSDYSKSYSLLKKSFRKDEYTPFFSPKFVVSINDTTSFGILFSEYQQEEYQKNIAYLENIDKLKLYDHSIIISLPKPSFDRPLVTPKDEINFPCTNCDMNSQIIDYCWDF